MSVKFTATWTCDGCKAKKAAGTTDLYQIAPWGWTQQATKKPEDVSPNIKHYCAKCAKEKGL